MITKHSNMDKQFFFKELEENVDQLPVTWGKPITVEKLFNGFSNEEITILNMLLAKLWNNNI